VSPRTAAAGVKYGDAVPGIVKRSDFERIKSILGLERFSLVAAVWLGAVDGREVVLVEPLADETLKKLTAACDRGDFCPDPTGFVASRVRILVLRDRDVIELVAADSQVRGRHGRLFDLEETGVTGAIAGWTGWPEAWENHVSVVLTPLTETGDGGIAAAADPPFILRWNEGAGRFQLYDCVLDKDDETHCGFRDEAD
ncbi:MAG: hypothetical protein ACRD5D_05810, partial [Candidatus Polarisedimenticolia bacterium]